MEQKPQLTRQQYLITMGFSLFLAVVGLAMMIFGVIFIRDGLASRGWDVVEGEVRTIRVRRETSANSSSNVRDFYYEVLYNYEYDDEDYTNNQYSLGRGSTAGENFDSEEEAREAGQGDYPIGREIDVYVNPGSPETAVLRPGASFSTFVPLILGSLFFPGGVALLWMIRRQKALQDRQPF